MATIKVIFQSKKGRTEQVANLIAQRCGIEASNVDIPTTFSGTDLLFVGVPAYKGRVEPSAIDYLEQLPVNQIKGAAIFTLSTDGLDHSSLVVNMLKHKGIEVYPNVLALPCAGIFSNKGRPNTSDLEKAIAWCDEVLRACRIIE